MTGRVARAPAIERLIRPPKFMRVARRAPIAPFIFSGPCTTFRPFVPPTPQSFIDSPPSNVGHSVSTLSSARCTLCCNNYMRCARVCILPSLSNIDNLACVCVLPRFAAIIGQRRIYARENVGAAPGALHTTAIFSVFASHEIWRGRGCTLSLYWK